MALQIDGGSEFKAAFERACQEPGVLKTQLALGPFHPEPMPCYPKGGQVLPMNQYTALRPAPVVWYESHEDIPTWKGWVLELAGSVMVAQKGGKE